MNKVLYTLFIATMLLLGYGAEAQVRPIQGGNNPFGNNRGNNRNNQFNNNGLNNDFDNNDSTLIDSTNAWQPKGIEYHEEIPDTTLQHSVFQFRYDPLAVKIKVVDYPSLDPTGVQHTDWLEGMNGNYYLSKGTLGQQHIALYQTMGDQQLYQYQPDVNIGYRKHPENIGLYQAQRPYSVLGFSSTIEKERRVMVSHSQNIMPRWNIAFDYKLFNPEGSYSGTSLSNHYLDAVTNYYSKDSRYQMATGIIWEKFRIDENGGIANDSIFMNRTQTNEAGVPVNMTGMGSIDKNLTAFTKHTYNTVRPVDKYKKRTEINHVRTDTIYDTIMGADSIPMVQPTFREVFDTVVSYDTIPPHKPMFFNTGVFGLEVRYDREKHVFADSSYTRKLTGHLYWTNDAYMDSRWRNPVKLMIGVRPMLFRGDMYDHTHIVSFNLTPMARVVVDTKIGALTVNAEKSFGTTYFKDGYRLDGDLKVYLDSAHRHSLYAQAVLQGQNPDLMYWYLDQKNYDLENIHIQKFEAGYKMREWLNWSVTARHIANNVWLEDSCKVHQADGSAWLFQSKIDATLHWAWFHYDMQHLLQYSTDQEQIRVPVFATKNSIYADVYIFKKALRAQFGIDVRYHTAFYADAYNPYVNSFYRQNDRKIGNYIWGDIFINLQIKRASIYAKAGHINALWEMHPNYYLLPHYPGSDFGFYYGIIWKFFD